MRKKKKKRKKCSLLEEFEEVLEHYGVSQEAEGLKEEFDKGTVIVKNNSEYASLLVF